MAALVEKKMNPPNVLMTIQLAMSSTPPPAKVNSKKCSSVECLDGVRRLCEHEQEIMHDIGVSPTTKVINNAAASAASD